MEIKPLSLDSEPSWRLCLVLGTCSLLLKGKISKSLKHPGVFLLSISRSENEVSLLLHCDLMLFHVMSIYQLKSSPTPPAWKDRTKGNVKVRGQGQGHAFKCSNLWEASSLQSSSNHWFTENQATSWEGVERQTPHHPPRPKQSFIRNPYLASKLPTKY